MATDKVHPAIDHLTARRLLARKLSSLAANYADTLDEHYLGRTDALDVYGSLPFTQGITEAYRELMAPLSDSRAAEFITWYADDYGDGQEREAERADLEKFTVDIRRMAETERQISRHLRNAARL